MKHIDKTKEQPIKKLAELRQRIGESETSELKREQAEEALEDQLLQAQKLETIGILAGSIAHDFNNHLTAILGNIELSRMRAQPGEQIYKSLSEAIEACLRAKDATERLSALSKSWAPMKKLGSFMGVMKDSANLALTGSNCTCEFSSPEDLWLVEFDKRHLKKAIHNVILNAVEAMTEGGMIKVSVENISIGAEKAEPVHAVQEGRYVRVMIQDQGIGISEEHLPRIFDPCFSTKEIGTQNGKGLGLATARAIIKKHGGYIHVKSGENTGSIFYIYLPAAEKEVMLDDVAEEKPLVGKKKVLLMDDEEIVRNITGEMLAHLGYHVEFAKDGVEAIELYKRSKQTGNPFNAVILDLTIPGGMGGEEAIQKLREIDPQIKAIVTSGYSHDPVMTNFGEYGFSGVISKPYKIEKLDRNLHEVISGERPGQW
jgi:signal transduction histidine kinase/ActR/RegA family two-component response regulator